MNISLPDSLKRFVDDQVSQRGFSTSSEYMRELIRKDQERIQLRNRLLEGASSEVRGRFDSDYFSGLRRRLQDEV